MANTRSLAVCDPDAFYPFRRLVEGGLTDPKDIEAAERFIRTAVLHDELIMGFEPLPSDPEAYEAKRQEAREKAALAAAAGTPFPPGVPVAAMIMFTQRGFQWDKHGYGLFSDALTEQSASAVELSRSQLEIVRAYSKADEGNPCYTTHLHYLQQLFGVVKEGGSVLCEHPFPRAAIEKATEFPVKLFEPLDSGWKQYAQRIQSGNLGLVLPPLLSIVMNNCARRDAIPAVVTDLRRDWAGARRKIWQLVDDQKNARTLEEVNDIDHELAEASKSLLSTSGAEGSSPLRMLWDIFAGATGGAVTAKMAGGDAKIGALTKAIPQIIGSAADAHSLFRLGAFDLAARIRRSVSAVAPVPDTLSRFLTETEKQALGYVSLK